MAYTEIQKRGRKKYYYLTHTVRLGVKYKKVRVFLGVDLSPKKLKEAVKKREKILDAKVSIIEKTEKEPFILKEDFTRRILPNSTLQKLESLKKKYTKKISLTDKDILQKVRKSFLIKYTYDTNASEGNTITLKETEMILSKGIIPKNHSLREVHEIENTRRAYNFIQQYEKELTHDFILKLHLLVTQNTLKNKRNEGTYRKRGQDVAMTGSKHFPPKGGRNIRELVSRLIEDYNKSKLSRIEAAILFHWSFIVVHPFIDGNGRVSRLLFNWILIKEDFAPINFPSKEHIEYTDLMEVARDGDPKPLANYILEKIVESLRMSTQKWVSLWTHTFIL